VGHENEPAECLVSDVDIDSLVVLLDDLDNTTVATTTLAYRGTGDMAATGRRRRMTLPTVPGREDPIYKPATKPTEMPAHGAAFIFVHGLGDSAEGLEGKQLP